MPMKPITNNDDLEQYIRELDLNQDIHDALVKRIQYDLSAAYWDGVHAGREDERLNWPMGGCPEIEE